MPSESRDSLRDQCPLLLYGTAWKEDATESLTLLALQQGFRGIDTANQRKHYFEAAVGQGVAAAIRDGVVARDELFLQTKFTFRAGQDQRLPYDAAAPVATQVEQSFASSLEHLATTRVESYVLHGPSQRQGLGSDDWSAWRAMEAIHDSGRTRWLGVSNVTCSQLDELCEEARVVPAFVQNRCYASRGWDREVRTFCQTHGLVYQGFSLLTGNRGVLTHPQLAQIARRHQCTPSQVVIRFALDIGVLPLTGTTSAAHMRQDLDVDQFQLDSSEIDQLEGLGMNVRN